MHEMVMADGNPGTDQIVTLVNIIELVVFQPTALGFNLHPA